MNDDEQPETGRGAPPLEISRRRFLKGGLAALGAVLPGAVFIKGLAAAGNPDSPVPQAPETLPQPIVIEGYETYGHDTPLTQAELDLLIAQFNAEPAPKDPMTIYSRKFVWGSGPEPEYAEYRYLPTIYPRYPTYQAFQAAHDEIFRSIIAPFGLSYQVRSLCVLDTAVTPPYIGDVEAIGDVDGNLHAGLFGRPYVPDLVDFDGFKDVDKSYSHEQGHQELKLPDTYALEVDFGGGTPSSNLPKSAQESALAERAFLQRELGVEPRTMDELKEDMGKMQITQASDVPLPLQDVPPEWRRYLLYDRSANDQRTLGLMNTLHYRLCSYTSWLLQRRIDQGWLHDASKAVHEHVWNFPHEVAPLNLLSFGPEWEGAEIQIYRTGSPTGSYLKKELNGPVIAGRLDTDGEMAVGDPWQGAPGEITTTPIPMIPSFDALLFIKVTKIGPDGNSKVGCRWVDIGDFSVGLGTSATKPEAIKMTMRLGDAQTLPTQLDTAIVYEDLALDNKIYLPGIQAKLQKVVPTQLV